MFRRTFRGIKLPHSRNTLMYVVKLWKITLNPNHYFLHCTLNILIHFRDLENRANEATRNIEFDEVLISTNSKYLIFEENRQNSILNKVLI